MKRVGMHLASIYPRPSISPLKVAPFTFDSEATIISTHIERNEITEATALIQAYSAKNGQNPQFFMLLGDLFSKIGRTTDAMETYSSGVKLFPTHTGLAQRLEF